MDLFRAFAGWLLVWAFGIALVRRAYAVRADAYPHAAWIAGAGFLAGAFALTLIMSVVSTMGSSFKLWPIGGPMLAAAVLLFAADRSAVRTLGSRAEARFAQWRASLLPLTVAKLAWAVLLAWLVVRGALLLGEVLRQPLFPWDAWTQWATKARVWFALRHMVPFEQAAAWLASGGGAYFDAAPHYPATVPLWQVWSSVAIGHYDDALMNLPWWFLGVALTLLLYGFFRESAASPLFALVATWMIVSMPIVETHVALAGYADLPMACFLTAAALAGFRAIRTGSIGDAIVAVFFVAALPTIKNPGWIWIAVLLPGLLVARLPHTGPRLVVAGWIVGVALVFVFGRYDLTVFGYHLHFQLNVPWHGLGEAYLSFANWHLLFWVLPAIVLATWPWVIGRELAPLTMVVGSGALFLMLGFSVTSAAVWVEDQSTVNRATLHLAPLIAVWLILLVQRALASGARPAVVQGASSGVASGVLPTQDAAGTLPVTAATVAAVVGTSADGRDA
jgi:hypothetical protein